MNSTKEVLLLTIPLSKLDDILIARQRARQIMNHLGFTSNEQTRMTTALSEIARNACQYANTGTIRFGIAPKHPASLVIYITDNGPGIINLSAVLEGKFISKTGLGLGILGAKRLVDSFTIRSSPSQGTQVSLSLELPSSLNLSTQLLGKIAEELVQHRPKAASEELHQQNQELMNAFDLLKKARDELEQRVAERTIQLTFANQTLQNEIERRKEIEHSLREMSDQLLLTLESASVGTWNWSLLTGELVWDKYACLIFGLEPGIFSGTFEDFLNYIVAEDCNRVKEEMQRLIEKRLNQAIEFRIKHPDGSIHYIISRGRVNYDINNKAINMIGIYWDITEQALIKEKTRIHREQMVEAARTSALGEMASSLAHEINQPLAAINVYTQGCIKRIENSDFNVAEINKILQIVVKQAQRAGKVIHRIRNFAKKGELLYESLSLNDMIKESIQMMQHEMEQYAVEIIYNIPPVNCYVNVDKIQIQQVIVNLIRNAMEAMQAEKTQHPRIIIEIIKNENDFIVTRILDKGPGIPADVMPRLFETYFTTKSQGMGLGLSICRSIIEAHGGQLTASNLPNLGSCFQFELPIGEQKHA